jgi:hypothetical protein
VPGAPDEGGTPGTEGDEETGTDPDSSNRRGRFPDRDDEGEDTEQPDSEQPLPPPPAEDADDDDDDDDYDERNSWADRYGDRYPRDGSRYGS